jgi:hypothetical protein
VAEGDDRTPLGRRTTTADSGPQPGIRYPPLKMVGGPRPPLGARPSITADKACDNDGRGVGEGSLEEQIRKHPGSPPYKAQEVPFLKRKVIKTCTVCPILDSKNTINQSNCDLDNWSERLGERFLTNYTRNIV